MTKAITARRSLLAAICIATVAGLSTAATGAPLRLLTDIDKPATNLIVKVASWSLSPGDFKGFDGSGKRQRVRIRSAGNGYTLQTLTGRNSGQVFYVHQYGDTYKAADGTTMQVTSSRSFIWNGWLGSIAMND